MNKPCCNKVHWRKLFARSWSSSQVPRQSFFIITVSPFPKYHEPGGGTFPKAMHHPFKHKSSNAEKIFPATIAASIKRRKLKQSSVARYASNANFAPAVTMPRHSVTLREGQNYLHGASLTRCQLQTGAAVGNLLLPFVGQECLLTPLPIPKPVGPAATLHNCSLEVRPWTMLQPDRARKQKSYCGNTISNASGEENRNSNRNEFAQTTAKNYAKSFAIHRFAAIHRKSGRYSFMMSWRSAGFVEPAENGRINYDNWAPGHYATAAAAPDTPGPIPTLPLPVASANRILHLQLNRRDEREMNGSILLQISCFVKS